MTFLRTYTSGSGKLYAIIPVWCAEQENVSGKITQAYLSSIKAVAQSLKEVTAARASSICIRINVNFFYDRIAHNWNGQSHKIQRYENWICRKSFSHKCHEIEHGIGSALALHYFNKFYFIKWLVVLVNQDTHSNVKKSLWHEVQGQHENVHWSNRLWKMLASHIYIQIYTQTLTLIHINSHSTTDGCERFALNWRDGYTLSVKSINSVGWYAQKTLLFGHRWMKRRVREVAECRWFIETFADKRNVTLFTMQSGIFIGFCDARFFLLELYERAAITTGNEQKKIERRLSPVVKCDFICQNITIVEAFDQSKLRTEATKGTAAASIEQLNMMIWSQWFDSDAYSILKYQNGCNKESPTKFYLGVGV